MATLCSSSHLVLSARKCPGDGSEGVFPPNAGMALKSSPHNISFPKENEDPAATDQTSLRTPLSAVLLCRSSLTCFHYMQAKALITAFSSCSEVILSGFLLGLCCGLFFFCFLIDEKSSAPVAEGFKKPGVIGK